MRKRSFVALDLPVDVPAMAAEVANLPGEVWGTTYWGTPHGSVSMVLLRGGQVGDQRDFLCEEVADRPILERLPTIQALLGSSPMEGCRYAFLFRMAPDGVTLVHTDGAEVWHGLHRIHVPITTHPEARLVVAGHAHHLAPGRAWTFDNQQLHGFCNGPTERVHLICDVAPSEALDALLEEAPVHRGREDPVAVSRIRDRSRGGVGYPGDAAVRQVRARARAEGASDEDVVAWLAAQGVPTRMHGGRWTLAALEAVLAEGRGTDAG